MFHSHIEIDGRRIGPGEPCYVIAEAGVNHFGQMDRAKRLVDMAVEAKADAVKFQTFNVHDMISAECPEWIERMGCKALDHNGFKELKAYCDSCSITFMSSAHDDGSLQFLNDLNVPAFKVGSGELNNLGYMQHVASYGRPVIFSTGMYTLDDIKTTLATFEQSGNPHIAMLHCVTLYPTPVEAVNLSVMDELKSLFCGPVGYSDHTIGYDICVASVAKGAHILEKHIALERDIPNTQDPIVSCVGGELAHMMKTIRRMEAAIGTPQKSLHPDEYKSIQWARKSIVAKYAIKMGETIKRDMLCVKRPGWGIPPTELDLLIGKKATLDIDQDSVIKKEWVS